VKGSAGIIVLCTAILVFAINLTTACDVLDVDATRAPTFTLMPTRTPQPSATIGGERTEARVIWVVDGDTIDVLIDGEEYTVRYIGIDAPETKHPSEPVEWMGPEATQANRQLVEGKTVWLEKDVSETDRYDRLLRYVYLGGGGQATMVNEELVRLGLAEAKAYPPDTKYQQLFLAAQRGAQDTGRGLWGPRE
jgi:micrococcal nuclease